MVPLSGKPKAHRVVPLLEKGGTLVKKTLVVWWPLCRREVLVEMDTVGNCSVVGSKPSPSAGMTILGDKNCVTLHKTQPRKP